MGRHEQAKKKNDLNNMLEPGICALLSVMLCRVPNTSMPNCSKMIVCQRLRGVKVTELIGARPECANEVKGSERKSRRNQGVKVACSGLVA